jgi:hypothetical protein
MSRRLSLVACVAAAALAAASSGFAAGPKNSPPGNSGPAKTAHDLATLSVQGVVQSVLPAAVVVRQLDGSAINVPVDRRTRFFVNGKLARPTDVKPGFVLVATWKAGRPAMILRFVKPT